MTYHVTKIDLLPIQIWAKKSLGAIVLGTMILGRPVSAQTIPSVVPTSIATVQSELVVTPSEQTTNVVAEPTVQAVLLDVCKTNGYGEDCAKTLLGMLWNESSNRSSVIGDSGQARGYFQIHYRLHKISIACAEDLVCSAQWSLNYLERNSYPKYVNYAIQCHNSCNVNNGYAAKAVRNAKLMWNKPLAVKQTAPIVLAMK